MGFKNWQWGHSRSRWMLLSHPTRKKNHVICKNGICQLKMNKNVTTKWSPAVFCSFLTWLLKQWINYEIQQFYDILTINIMSPSLACWIKNVNRLQMAPGLYFAHPWGEAQYFFLSIKRIIPPSSLPPLPDSLTPSMSDLWPPWGLGICYIYI